MFRTTAIVAIALFVAVGCTAGTTGGEEAMTDSSDTDGVDWIDIEPAEPTYELSDEEWRERLSDDEYHILREEGTEPAFSGELLGNERDGTYTCAGCGHELFSSATRFDSGTGWPSYTAPLDDDAVGTREDMSTGRMRV